MGGGETLNPKPHTLIELAWGFEGWPAQTFLAGEAVRDTLSVCNHGRDLSLDSHGGFRKKEVPFLGVPLRGFGLKGVPLFWENAHVRALVDDPSSGVLQRIPLHSSNTKPRRSSASAAFCQKVWATAGSSTLQLFSGAACTYCWLAGNGGSIGPQNFSPLRDSTGYLPSFPTNPPVSSVEGEGRVCNPRLLRLVQGVGVRPGQLLGLFGSFRV